MSETLNLAFALAWMLAIPAAHSQEVRPDVLVKNVTEEVIAEIRKDKGLQAGDPAKTAAMVQSKVVPHFDFGRITQTAVGKSWRSATPEQQERLTEEFKTLLVRTYSGALANYRDQVIEFRPLRAAAAETDVTVKSVVRQPGTSPIAIEYDVAKSGGQWKVYDVRIDGISLIATYRSAFAEEVANRGVDGLISLLARKNRQT